MNQNGERNRVDNWLDNIMLPRIDAAQIDYLAAHGRYFQGLLTHTVRPQHTSQGHGDSNADSLDNAPTDQSEDWEDFIPVPSGIFNNMPCGIAIDVYDGPQGSGYVVNALFDFDADENIKRINTGYETHNDKDWQV